MMRILFEGHMTDLSYDVDGPEAITGNSHIWDLPGQLTTHLALAPGPHFALVAVAPYSLSSSLARPQRPFSAEAALVPRNCRKRPRESVAGRQSVALNF